jgi:hypothetical protein
VLLALAATASGAPEVRFKATVVPIPGYAETGNLFNGGAALRIEYLITGHEYEGSPPPLAGISFQLPEGFRLDLRGWPSCPHNPLEPEAPGPGGWPARCRPATHAGPSGTVGAFVTVRGQRESETANVELIRGAGGEVEFRAFGYQPASLEVFSAGRYAHLPGGGGFGPELDFELPLVPSVPGAPFMSIETIQLQLGSARGPKTPRKAGYYLTLPARRCPRLGWKFKAEVVFAAVDGLPSQAATSTYRAPCPRRSARR